MDKKIIKKYLKNFIKYLVGIILFGLYIAFILLHWTIPYTDYWIKLIIFAVVIFILGIKKKYFLKLFKILSLFYSVANLAKKVSAIHNNSQRRRKTLRSMEEGQSHAVQTDIELKSLKDENSNVIEKSLNVKTVESIAEAIVQDIEHEVSHRLSNFDGSEQNMSSLKDVQNT